MDLRNLVNRLDTNNNTAGRLRRQPRKSLVSLDSQSHDQNCNDDDKKKMMHRDMERKRRQEMAALYASLRSVLPHEYIKGKRSLVDHMNEALNYINHLKMRIKTLGAEKDELKRLSKLSVLGPAGNICVAVHPNCLGGIEIVISTTAGGSGEQGGLVLSSLLDILVGQGLTVISCATAQLNKRLIYTIQSQVRDPTCIDISGLQQNLTEAISSSTLFSK